MRRGRRAPLLHARLTEDPTGIAAHEAGAELAGVRDLAELARIECSVPPVIASNPMLDALLMMPAKGSRPHSDSPFS